MRSRERLAGFCFQFAQTDFFCVCVCFFSFWKFTADRHFLQKLSFSREKYLAKAFCPFQFPPCSLHLAPQCPHRTVSLTAPPVLHELGAQRGSSEPGGWTRRWVWPGAGSWLGISSPGGAGMRGQPGAGRRPPQMCRQLLTSGSLPRSSRCCLPGHNLPPHRTSERTGCARQGHLGTSAARRPGICSSSPPSEPLLRAKRHRADLVPSRPAHEVCRSCSPCWQAGGQPGV